MANPVEKVASAVTAPVGWAKARPFVFVGLVLGAAILAIKFGPTILRWLGKTPVVGGKVVAFATPNSSSRA
ncbi:MAG TPA: hypothetical protein VJV75_03800 [Candidatus Polarisedimenticolia bacterium]|nr:hypothetical protein [Candidatus Polarisedimenticolia bacterium]